MKPLIFCFDAAQYYGLEIHAGTLGFDVFRGYLIHLLRQQASEAGVSLINTTAPERRQFSSHPSPCAGTLKIELLLEEDEFAFAEGLGKQLWMINEGTDWPTMVVKHLVALEGIVLWDSMPTGSLVEKGVRYDLSLDRACFHASSIKVGAGEEMALPPTPYRFSSNP